MDRTVRFPGGVFPLGTHVYREPPQDQDELMADLPILKKLGFNMIKIQEHWSIDETREGEIDLSRIERVIAKAGELSLGVYLGLTMEQAPAWLWKKYPDCRLVYASGLPHDYPAWYTLPADGKPGPCWDHPGAREAGERFVAELARRLGRFDNIWCWNTWQEIGFWPNDGGVLGFCYCPHTLRLFREWLQAKYASLDALNKTWQTGFGEWDEVEPPRHAQETSAPNFIDWRYFMDDVYMPRALEWKTRALKVNDPGHRPVFSHAGTVSWFGSASEWRWARVGDFWGNSNYPNWYMQGGWDDARIRASRQAFREQEIWNGVMIRAEYCRAANGLDRTFIGAEFQGGPLCTHLQRGPVPTAEDIRRWMLSGLAGGMNGISFWNHRVESFWAECNGFGLLDAQGDSTERIEEAGRIGRAVNADPELFTEGRPPRAEVAILVNEDLYHFCQGTGNNAAGHLNHSTRGHYYRLWKMGVAVDFVEAAELAESALAGYKVAILPVPLALDAGYFAHLADFVCEGGMLISEACPGRFEKYGTCPRSQMVAGGEELFGARHKDVRIVWGDEAMARQLPPERAWQEFGPPTVLEGVGPLDGARLRASFYLQTLIPTTGEPILTAGGETTGVLHPCGKGHAVLIGTFAGQSAIVNRLDRPENCFERLLELAGVGRDVCGRFLRRRRVLGNREAWFLINCADEPVTERVLLDGYEFERDLLDDSVTARDEQGVTVRVPAGNLACLCVSRVKP